VTCDFPSARRYSSWPLFRNFCKTAGELVRERDRHRHQLRRFVRGVAEHHALVAAPPVSTPMAISPDCLLIDEITEQVLESNPKGALL